ncbi:hypothetical protein AB0873_14825 [Micromonospora sp. NPDC047707]|uniref:hypothetical protein n=1 Tax=Micromonospora sp. NPDC047707 TaxID=3154498 RepID=UPI00345542DE
MSTKTTRPGLRAATAAGAIAVDPDPSARPAAADASTLVMPAVDHPGAAASPADLAEWDVDEEGRRQAAADEAAGGGTQSCDCLPDEPRTWWFTFPQDGPFGGRYAVTFGVRDAAREELLGHFGHVFAGQFASAEEAGVQRLGLMRLRRDQWPADAAAVPAGAEPAAAGDAPGQPAAVSPADPAPDGEGLDVCGRCASPRKCANMAVCQRTPADDDPGQVEHFHLSASVGDGPGQSSATCACGVTFAGFDTIAEAVSLLDQHIADSDGAGEPAGPAGPEPRRVKAAELVAGMFVATGDPEWPGAEVRHVEPSDEGERFVGVVYAGPAYSEYDVDQVVELVDRDVVEQAAARARARAHRAQQIEALRRLAALAEADEFFPLPRFTLQVDAGLESPEAVRRFASALDIPVTEDGYGLRARWCYGGTELNPAVQVEAAAPHPQHTPPAGVR